MKQTKSPSEPQDDLRNKHLLVVNSGYRRKEFILKRIQELGCTIILLNKERNWAQKYVDSFILADTNNHSESLEAVKKYAEHSPIDGVITFWEDDVLLCAKIVDMLGLPGIPYRVARVARNKYLFRDFCKEAGLPTPQHRTISSQDDVDFVIEHFNFPVIAKPVYGSSSALVVKIEKKRDLQKIIQYISENISEKMESALMAGSQIFVEEYLLITSRPTSHSSLKSETPYPQVSWKKASKSYSKWHRKRLKNLGFSRDAYTLKQSGPREAHSPLR